MLSVLWWNKPLCQSTTTSKMINKKWQPKASKNKNQWHNKSISLDITVEWSVKAK